MTDIKATVTGDNVDAGFQIWQGYIQKPKWELDTFTRLGGSRIITQKTRRLANPSQINAMFLSDDVGTIDSHIQSLLDAVGDFVTVKYYGESITNVLLLDVQYNKRAVDGTHKNLVEYVLFFRAEEQE